MAKYYEQATLIEYLNKNVATLEDGFTTMDCVTLAILYTPTADVVEVKRGEWKNVVVYNDTCIATCSNCRRQIVERECNATAFKLENEFCRKCGADMRGGKNDL